MLISNPLADPLFLPTLGLLAVLLIDSLLALWALAGFNTARLRGGVLFARWRVWACIAPIYGLSLFCGVLTLLALVTFLVYQGLREYSRLVGLPRTQGWILQGAGMIAVPAAAISPDTFYHLAPLLLIGATLQPLLPSADGAGVRHLAFVVFGWGYIPFLLGHLVLLYRYVDGGPGILLALGLATALSDVGAYVVGKRFGRRKLAPRLSPNKTWAGVVGNLAGAYLGVALMAYALPASPRPLLLAALPPVIALGALWGDLLESSIKREFERKDAGAWLPEFGGLLDRVDSLIVVAPLAYYSLRLIS